LLAPAGHGTALLSPILPPTPPKPKEMPSGRGDYWLLKNC
jgi:hypothetical protein